MTEHRYGDHNTIWGTNYLDVEIDSKGRVVAVWFRCLALPFKQVKVKRQRASEMQAMSTHVNSYVKLNAVIFENLMEKH